MAGVAFQKFSELADQNLQSGSIETAKIYLKALGQLLHGQPDWTNIGIILTTKKAADYWLSNQSDYEMLDIIAKLVLSYSKMHEENRSDSMAEGIPQILCQVFKDVNFDQDHFIDAIRSSCAAIQGPHWFIILKCSTSHEMSFVSIKFFAYKIVNQN